MAVYDGAKKVKKKTAKSFLLFETDHLGGVATVNRGHLKQKLKRAKENYELRSDNWKQKTSLSFMAHGTRDFYFRRGILLTKIRKQYLNSFLSWGRFHINNHAGTVVVVGYPHIMVNNDF